MTTLIFASMNPMRFPVPSDRVFVERTRRELASADLRVRSILGLKPLKAEMNGKSKGFVPPLIHDSSVFLSPYLFTPTERAILRVLAEGMPVTRAFLISTVGTTYRAYRQHLMNLREKGVDIREIHEIVRFATAGERIEGSTQ